jgi:hypothetical protein
MKLAKFMMASTGVGEDLNTIKTHQNVGTRGSAMRNTITDVKWTTAHLAGVNNSSHNSTPKQVSIVLTTASPNGTLFYVEVNESLVHNWKRNK